MKLKGTILFFVILTAILGSRIFIMTNKAHVYETGMNSGIQDALRDSALFFENESYEMDYIEPLYTLNGYTEMQYNYMQMTSNADFYTVARVLKKFVQPELYAKLTTEQKVRTAQYLRQLADEDKVDFEKELLPFLNELAAL